MMAVVDCRSVLWSGSSSCLGLVGWRYGCWGGLVWFWWLWCWSTICPCALVVVWELCCCSSMCFWCYESVLGMEAITIVEVSQHCLDHLNLLNFVREDILSLVKTTTNRRPVVACALDSLIFWADDSIILLTNGQHNLWWCNMTLSNSTISHLISFKLTVSTIMTLSTFLICRMCSKMTENEAEIWHQKQTK